jgi:hypothetical protein
MQLKVKRSQRTTGLMGNTVVFCADIRAEYTDEERANINKYGLGGEVIYNSRAAADHLERMGRQVNGTTGGLLKGLGSLVLAKMNLNITIASLKQGHHIECKDLGELLECEEAVMTACKNLKGFLEAAATFDGREILVDLDEQMAA